MPIKKRTIALFSIIILFFTFCTISSYSADEQKVSASLLTDSAGHASQKAMSSVFKIICPKHVKMGTGFLHKSGRVLTAAHVVSDCNPEDVFIILPRGTKVSVKKIIADNDIDIASLTPNQIIKGIALPIMTKDTVSLGAQVSTWGFPAGYTGNLPMLSVGYLSGRDAIKSPSGKIVGRLVINAAFNSGNSGGPLIDIESKSVIGIVSSKLAPIPPDIEKALSALKEVEFGVTFSYTKSDGSEGKISQSQLLEKILQYMRSQTQLVVGRAVLLGDVKLFLKKHGIEN